MIELCIRRPVTVTVCAVIVLFAGLLSLSRLPWNFLPPVEDPRLSVVIRCPNASAAYIEEHVSRLIGAEALTIANVQLIEAASREGEATVLLTFRWNTDMTAATLALREKLDNLALPQDCERPVLSTFDPNQSPVMRIAITQQQGRSLDAESLRRRLMLAPGVSSVELVGAADDEITVSAPRELLNAAGIDASAIGAALARANVTWNCGTVREGDREIPLQVRTSVQRWQELRRLPIPLPNGATVELGALAELREVRRRDSLVRLNGADAVGLDVYRAADANIVEVSKAVRAELESIGADNPSLDLLVTQDQADYVRQAIRGLLYSLLWGALLAFCTLFLFLRDVPSILSIGVAIPLAAISVFLPMHFLGLSLNMISLTGLALGLGMLVDNSIVVTENVFRHRRGAAEWATAARLGTGEVVGAMLASTLSTLAVFLPIVFIRGIMSLLFREQALATGASLVASLLVAVTVLPMTLARRRGEPRANVAAWTNSRPYRLLGRVLDWLLGHKAVAVGIFLLFVLGGAALLVTRPREYFPPVSQQELRLTVPAGAGRDYVLRQIAAMERPLLADPDLDRIYMEYRAQGEDAGELEYILHLEKGVRPERKLAAMRRVYAAPPLNADVQPAGDMLTNLVNRGSEGLVLNVTGEGDTEGYARLLAARLRERLPSAQVRSDLDDTAPVVTFCPNYRALAAHGVTLEDIAAELTLTYQGVEYGELEGAGQSLVLRFATLDTLLPAKTIAHDGLLIPLAQLGSLNEQTAPRTLRLSGRQRVWPITVAAPGAMSSLLRQVNRVLAETSPPANVQAELSGSNRWFADSMRELLFALVVSLALVYLIMAAQFESFRLPFIIMLSVPLGIGGAALLLWLTGTSLNAMSFMGIIIMGGIVVNNAILLVDFAARRQRAGETPEAAARAATLIRLRPICMTTLTTVTGLLPLTLATHGAAGLQRSLALSLIGGLLAATALNLTVLPVLYALLARRSAAERG